MPLSLTLFQPDGPARQPCCCTGRAHEEVRSVPFAAAARSGKEVLARLLVLSLLILSGGVELTASALAAEEKPHAREKKTKAAQGLLTKKDLVAIEQDILRFTNVARKREGIAPLRNSPALDFLARGQSRNMCRTRSLEHESNEFPAGWKLFPERLEVVGLKAGAENIAYRTITKKTEEWARVIVKGWLKSPRHRENMLNPAYRYLGVGVMPCEDRAYATQVFSPHPGLVPERRDERADLGNPGERLR